MEGQDPFGESSVAEHQPLKLGGAGSNPAPRSEHDHHSGVGELVDPPAFEAGHVGGSKPPTRTPELRKGYEITLANGTTLGWFHTRNDDMVLTAGGLPFAFMPPGEWATFVGHLNATTPGPAPEPKFSDEQARLLYEECEGTVQKLLDQAVAQARQIGSLWDEVTRARLEAAEGAQAALEATEVIASLTDQLHAMAEENDRMDEAVKRLNGVIVRQEDTIAALNIENRRLAAANSEQAGIILETRRENVRLRTDGT